MVACHIMKLLSGFSQFLEFRFRENPNERFPPQTNGQKESYPYQHASSSSFV